jgi:hypothetical protein
MKHYSGINIQFPISRLILNKSKTIETRTYPVPSKYLNQEILMVETPGPSGNFKSRAVAIVRFNSCYKYRSKRHFYEEVHLHKVDSNSPWAWTKEKGKWAWTIDLVETLLSPVEIKKRLGIRFTKEIATSRVVKTEKTNGRTSIPRSKRKSKLM